jgi:hypothetical protein
MARAPLSRIVAVRRLVACALIAVAALALGACGGGGGNKDQSSTSHSSGASGSSGGGGSSRGGKSSGGGASSGGRTTTSPTTGGGSAHRQVAAEQRRAAGVERVVTRLVEATEQGNGPAACRLLGLSPKGSGLVALRDCAGRAHVDLTALPNSDELSFGPVAVSDGSARVSMTGGPTLTLHRSGASWRVVALRAPAGSGY